MTVHIGARVRLVSHPRGVLVVDRFAPQGSDHPWLAVHTRVWHRHLVVCAEDCCPATVHIRTHPVRRLLRRFGVIR